MTQSETQRLTEIQHRAPLLALALVRTLRAWAALDQAGAAHFAAQLLGDLREALESTRDPCRRSSQCEIK